MPRRVFITGASSGIGAALARALRRATGATLGLVARRARRRSQRSPVAARRRRRPTPPTSPTPPRCGSRGATSSPAHGVARHRHRQRRHLGRHARRRAGGRRAVCERVLRTNVVGLAATLAPSSRRCAQRGSGIARRHRERRGLPRPARRGRLLGVQGGRDHLAREPARRARAAAASPWSPSAPATSTRR